MTNKLFTITSIAVLALFSFFRTSYAYELEWDQTRVEVELEPGQKEARAEFTVTNNGKETVQIDRIKTSCGCTGSILDQKEIKPGESSTIIGTFDKGDKQGLNQNQLQVFLEDQAEPVETLHMVVQIPKLIETSPSIVYWNRAAAKTERQVRIKLDRRYLKKISRIEYDSELLVISETDDPEGNFDRILTILPKSFDEQLRHTVRIKAKGKGGLDTEVKLQVFVQP